MAMTKTARLKRARAVRSRIGRFIDLQNLALQEALRPQLDVGPEYAAMDHLLLARQSLDSLIRDLRAEGYGAEASR